MIRVFCGYDPREAIGFHVFAHSLIEHASAPVQITPLAETGMPAGSNAFTFSRFLVPWLCNFEGHAIFLDGADMLMLDDIAELESVFDPKYAVQVVRHAPYKTRHPIKYRGTSMQCPNRDYARKNWASVMLINCAHPGWGRIDDSISNEHTLLMLLQLQHLRDADIGALPAHWNVLADEGQSIDGAAVLHWTAGAPFIPAYHDAPGATRWHAARERMLEVP
jgi:hypothetical protein